MNFVESLRAIASVATKEFLHVYRDRRILVLILVLPPLLTVIFGHAFEMTAMKDAPTLLQDRDQTTESRAFTEALSKNKTFAWKVQPETAKTDLLHANALAALVIPAGWGKSLRDGNPAPLQMILDGGDTTTADQLEGSLRQTLGSFQKQSLDKMVENLPDDVIEMGQKLPVETRKQFVSAMEAWDVKSQVLFNPKKRFIDFVTPGIIGLILQLLTVTLMACTITREREAGTLSQLLITSLRRGEIVVGKVLPYLGISMFLIGSSVAVSYFYFGVQFHQPLVLACLCLLFLLCSLGLGLLISAICTNQTQAIQVAVFYLLPVFPLSGAFAPLEQLPQGIRYISETFPLTHFCHAFRLINLYNAELSFIQGDLIFLLAGALVTCGGAAFLLSRAQE